VDISIILRAIHVNQDDAYLAQVSEEVKKA
jgi:hypothetical protein